MSDVPNCADCPHYDSAKDLCKLPECKYALQQEREEEAAFMEAQEAANEQEVSE